MRAAPRSPYQRLLPGDVVTASAPIRVCDVGGWTDTWFSGRGAVFNIAVSPRVEVRLHVTSLDAVPSRITLDVSNFGDVYAFEPGQAPGRHPLLEAVFSDCELPDGLALEARISSDVPAGSSTGTSAAVAVALIGALDSMTRRPRRPGEVARAAHRVEVDRLGLQSGVQDQVCAAFGGVNFIDIDPYPEAARTPVRLRRRVREQLEQRMLVLYLGAHRSSEMHERVIASLAEDPDCPALQELRDCAVAARDAVAVGDLEQLGQAMTRSTEAQRNLHQSLVGDAAQAAIDIAAADGVTGWKVNGAGGEGGSLTFLGPVDSTARAGLESDLLAGDPAFRLIPVRLSDDGLRVTRSSS